MSSDSSEEALHQLVIVRRRRGGGEEGHHGGVWKIAYADFMTAMMAFFLVMWLVNMTDDEKVTQIANYFNPIQLTEKAPPKKGLNDTSPSDRAEAEAGEEGTTQSAGESAKPQHSKAVSPGKARHEKARQEKAAQAEAKLFLDPMKTLDELAGKDSSAGAQEGMTISTDEQRAGLSGDKLLDPFDPFPMGLEPTKAKQSAVSGNADKAAKENPEGVSPAAAPGESAPPGQPTREEAKPEPTAKENPEGVSPAAGPGESAPPGQPTREEAKPEPTAKPDGGESNAGIEAERSAIQAEADKVRESIEKSVRDLQGPLPDIKVKATENGVLVSIQDDTAFGMFSVASAEPLPRTVQVVERVGAILRDSEGTVVIRGHTDGRAYRGSGYDNWRLSTARAHMAYYMLVRSGFSEKRVERIEGLADRELISPDHPNAPQNRRIEFLLRAPVK